MSLYDKLAKNETCLKIVRKLRTINVERNKKKRVKGKDLWAIKWVT